MKLNRRQFVAGSAAAISSAAIISRAHAAEFEYKFGNSTPAAHPFNIRMNEMSKRVLEETGGRLNITIYPNSQLGGDNDLLSQVRTGAVEFCQPAGLILASILPLTSINGMGFAWTGYDKIWPAMDGRLGAHIRGKIESGTGLIPMERMWDLGFRQITNNRRPIRSAADLEGLKLRVPGAPALVSLFQGLGVDPVSMQFGEVYTSLQTNVVDGQENPLSTIDAAKLYEVQKYCSITNHVWDGHWIVANAGAWNRLPADVRDTARKVMNEVALLQREDVAALNQSVRSRLVAAGLEFNDAETGSFREKLRASGFYAEWRGKIGNEAWEILESYAGKRG